MLDWLRIAFYVGLAAFLLFITCLIYVGIATSGSRNILLAIGVFVASLVGLGVTMLFELRGSEIAGVMGTKFATDYAKPKIEQFRYPLASSTRARLEMDANKFLLKDNPKAYEGDGEKLWRDMSLLSVVLYLWAEQHDWQTAREVVDNYTEFSYLSNRDQPDQCSKVELSEIQDKLRQVGNVFAGYEPQLLFQFMCLPPRSSLRIEADQVRIETPYCKVRFILDPLWRGKASWRPGTNGSEQPLLPNGRPRFETRTGIVRTRITCDWIRAQSREMPKYQAWANDVVERARKWFNTEIPDAGQFVGGDFN